MNNLTDILQKLESTRLLIFDGENYELSHDTLARKIAEKRSAEEKALIEWELLIKNKLRASLQAASPDYLTTAQLTGLAELEHKLFLSKEEKEFVMASHKYVAEQERKEKRRRRMVLGGVSLFALVLLLGILMIYGQYQITQKKELKARSLALAAEAQRIIKEDHTKAFRLAELAYKMDSDNFRAQNILYQAFYSTSYLCEKTPTKPQVCNRWYGRFISIVEDSLLMYSMGGAELDSNYFLIRSSLTAPYIKDTLFNLPRKKGEEIKLSPSYIHLLVHTDSSIQVYEQHNSIPVWNLEGNLYNKALWVSDSLIVIVQGRKIKVYDIYAGGKIVHIDSSATFCDPQRGWCSYQGIKSFAPSKIIYDNPSFVWNLVTNEKREAIFIAGSSHGTYVALKVDGIIALFKSIDLNNPIYSFPLEVKAIQFLPNEHYLLALDNNRRFEKVNASFIDINDLPSSGKLIPDLSFESHVIDFSKDYKKVFNNKSVRILNEGILKENRIAFEDDGVLINNTNKVITYNKNKKSIKLWVTNISKDSLIKAYPNSDKFKPLQQRLFLPRKKQYVKQKDLSTLEFWDEELDSDSPQLSIESPNGELFCVQYVSKDQKYIFSGTIDGKLLIWDLKLKNPSPIQLIGGNTWVQDVALSKTAKYAAGALQEGIIKIWDLETVSELGTIKVRANAIGFIENEKQEYIYVVEKEGLSIRSIKDPSEVKYFYKHKNIENAIFEENSNKFITFDKHSFKVWDKNVERRSQLYMACPVIINNADFTAEKDAIIINKGSNQIRYALNVNELIETMNREGVIQLTEEEIEEFK